MAIEDFLGQIQRIPCGAGMVRGPSGFLSYPTSLSHTLYLCSFLPPLGSLNSLFISIYSVIDARECIGKYAFFSIDVLYVEIERGLGFQPSDPSLISDCLSH